MAGAVMLCVHCLALAKEYGCFTEALYRLLHMCRGVAMARFPIDGLRKKGGEKKKGREIGHNTSKRIVSRYMLPLGRRDTISWYKLKIECEGVRTLIGLKYSHFLTAVNETILTHDCTSQMNSLNLD